MAKQMLAAGQLGRCRLRLQNDARALEAAVSDRLQVVVRKFGNLVRRIDVTLPGVRTGFFHLARKQVTVHPSRVEAQICPNAGNAFAYPLGAPMVMVFFPELADDEQPWLSGLWWIAGKRSAQQPDGQIQEMLADMADMMDAALQRFDGKGVGIPCLWRQGEWNWERDLLFVVDQLHRLLTDPGQYSPRDALNPKAAYHWAAHKDELPLEPPLAEIGKNRGGKTPQGRQSRFCGLKLVRLE